MILKRRRGRGCFAVGGGVEEGGAVARWDFVKGRVAHSLRRDGWLRRHRLQARHQHSVDDWP